MLIKNMWTTKIAEHMTIKLLYNKQGYVRMGAGMEVHKQINLSYNNSYMQIVDIM